MRGENDGVFEDVTSENYDDVIINNDVDVLLFFDFLIRYFL